MRVRIRYLSHRELSRPFFLLFILLMVFSLIFVCSYISRSLETADETVDARALSISQTLQKKLRDLMLTGFMVYEDQRVFDWINAAEPRSELDVQVVSATRGFLRTNDVLHDIVLYNPNTGFIYSARNHTYRDPGLMKDFDVEALLAAPEEEHLRFHLIDYDQGQALALLLPHRLQHGRLIMIFNIQRVAESVSAVLTETPVDGVATFVLDADGQTVIMGAAPEGYATGSGSGSAAWLRFLRDGCLDRSHTTSTQGWTVHAVLYMDSFMTTYMPFVKVVVLITALLFLILTVLLLVYSRFLRKPFSQLADTLRSSLPDGGAAQPERQRHSLRAAERHPLPASSARPG